MDDVIRLQFNLIDLAKAQAPDPNWKDLRIICNAVNNYFEIQLDFFFDPQRQRSINIDKLPVTVAHEFREAFRTLRVAAHAADPYCGAWYVATITASSRGQCGMYLDMNRKPKFDGFVTERDFVADNETWRTQSAQTPEWLSAMLIIAITSGVDATLKGRSQTRSRSAAVSMFGT
jgi:hypothetical protein